MSHFLKRGKSMDNEKRNYIIGAIAAVTIALIGFFFYDSGEVVVADTTEPAMEVVVVADGSNDDQGVETTDEDKSETIPAVETTEAEDANAE
tara:strand:- start:3270 stop:3545 length:276 start_codon:yes stop_codon:yes gene_type:complete